MSQCDSTPLIAAQANISLLQMSKLLNSLINDHLIKLKSSHMSEFKFTRKPRNSSKNTVLDLLLHNLTTDQNAQISQILAAKRTDHMYST